MDGADDRDRQPGWDGGETLEETAAILRDHAAATRERIASARELLEGGQERVDPPDAG